MEDQAGPDFAGICVLYRAINGDKGSSSSPVHCTTAGMYFGDELHATTSGRSAIVVRLVTLTLSSLHPLSGKVGK